MNTNTLDSLEDFGGWGEGAEQDFFSEEVEEVEDPLEDKKPEEKTEPKKKEEEVNFFEDSEDPEEEEEEEEDEDKKKSPEEVSQSSTISTLNFLKEKGHIDYELEEGEELTEELADELIESSIEDRVNDKLKSLPTKAQQLIQYALKGGDVDAFIKEVSKTSSVSITADLDLEEEDNQELVVREVMLSEGEDEETIEAQIEFLKDSGKLENFSKKKHQKWLNQDTKKRESLLEEQREQIRLQKEQLRKAKQEALDFVSENDSIGDLKFTRQDKKVIPSYMNDRTIKLENGSSITEMQKELFYDLPRNKEAFMQLAVLLKNRNKDGTFNFKTLEKQIKTQVVKEVKDNVRRSKSNVPKSTNNNKRGSSKSLAEIFSN